jgi:hypothetical protein
MAGYPYLMPKGITCKTLVAFAFFFGFCLNFGKLFVWEIIVSYLCCDIHH